MTRLDAVEILNCQCFHVLFIQNLMSLWWLYAVKLILFLINVIIMKKDWFSKNYYLFNILNGSSWLLLLHVCIFTPTGALVIHYT